MSSGKVKTTVEFWSARAPAASTDSAAATTHFGSVVEAATIQVLDDIWSPWCAPCRKVSPALEQLAGRLKLVKVNADESPELRQRFEVLATPTLLLIVRGEFIDKQLGAAPAGVAGLGDVEARSLPPHDHFALVSDTPR